MKVVTSLENEKVKKFYKLLRNKKYRDDYGQYIIEGKHLVVEAYKTGSIQELILEEGEEAFLPVPYTYYSKEIMKRISTMDSPPPIMALCNKLKRDDIKGDKILILDQIQDPGNLGTIIRSAVAFNIDTIILSENSVDLYNPKVLRATQGMFYNINIISRRATEVVLILQNLDIPVYGTDVVTGVEASTLSEEEKERFALIVGNEGNGVRESVSELCDKNLYIKMNPNAESLNVGVAASILLYEMGRNREKVVSWEDSVDAWD